jgi:hypothetical protein
MFDFSQMSSERRQAIANVSPNEDFSNRYLEDTSDESKSGMPDNLRQVTK